MVDPVLAAQLRLDGVITLVHGQHIVQQLREHPEAANQVGYADHIIVNHCDQCDSGMLEAAEAAIRSCNQQATVERATQAQVEIGTLLRTRTWDTITLPPTPAVDAPAADYTHHDHDHTVPHTCDVSTLTLRAAVPLDLNRLKLWLLFIAKRRSHELMRFKGILQCQNQAAAVIVQGVYQWFELRQGSDPVPAESVFVLIGRHLDMAELQREWEDCRARP
jgi:G3E family GTPase